MECRVPKAIFFDFDNTLQDMDAAYNEAVTSTLGPVCMGSGVDLGSLMQVMAMVRAEIWTEAQRGHIRIPQEHIYRVWFTEVFRRCQIPQPELQAVAIEGVYRASFERGLRLFDDVLPALTILRDSRSDIALGILTNGPSAIQRRRIQARGLSRFMEHLVTSEDAQAAKPDARIFRYALSMAGIGPTDAVLVGDDPTVDVAGAQAAGWHAVLIDRKGVRHEAGDAPVARDLIEACELAVAG